MSRRSLSYESIMKTAIKLVEQKGFNNFSLRELAAELQVQPSSLYNHIRGINEIQKAVGLYGIHEMEKGLTEASREKYGAGIKKNGTLVPGLCQKQS